MVIDQHDDDPCGETRTDRIVHQAQDAGEAAMRRAVAARRRGEAASKRAAELREWGGRSPGRSRDVADRAAEAAERTGDMTRAIEHRRAAAHDRAAATDDLSHRQQTTATRSGYGLICGAK